MSNELASVEPDGPLYRLGRHPDPWAIFEPAPDRASPLVETRFAAVEAQDRDLRAALDLLGVTLA